jgi:hypothetical protein
MAQAVIHQPVTSEGRVQNQVIPCDVYGGQGGNGAEFSPSLMCSISVHYVIQKH